MTPLVSVIICTHNPEPERLRRTFAALKAQTLPAPDWETLLVDNASTQPVALGSYAGAAPGNVRILNEPWLGLSAARSRGLRESTAAVAVFVDDDNLLAPDYLTNVLAGFERFPQVGLLGGRSLPTFEREPLPWHTEFLPLLALRDLGTKTILSSGLRPPGADRNQYPACAPIGAGMALRRESWTPWLESYSTLGVSDRRGSELSSAGDNDIVFVAMKSGWEVGYCPELSLRHLIPATRLQPHYLGRLNRGIQKSWAQVLARHDASPWPPLTHRGAALRKARAYLTYRAWAGTRSYIRWQGACGHFEGRIP